MGVYVQDGDVVRFKTINIIYENSEHSFSVEPTLIWSALWRFMTK